MTNPTDVREFLRQMADEVPLSPVEPRPAVRRAKRRLVRTLSAATLVLAAIVAGSAVGIGRLTAAPPPVPVHPGPSFLPAYHHNGDIAVYGFLGSQPIVVAVNPVTEHQRLLPITPDEPLGVNDEDVLAWSPDGRQLAFIAHQPDPLAPSLLILDVARGTSRKIAPCPCNGLAWSPDGSTIAATADTGLLNLIGTDGHIEARLTPKPGSGLLGPTWSPDGSTIAYLAVEPVKSGGIEYVLSMVDIAGSHPVQVLRAGRCDCNLHPGITWSPDGTKLALVVPGSPDMGPGLYVVNRDGTDLHLITGVGWGSPSWRPVP